MQKISFIRRKNSSVDFYIINHDGLGVGSSKSNRGFNLGDLAKFIRDNPAISAIGVDEGTAYANGSTDRYKVFRQVADSKPYVWWFTGTPTGGKPIKAWAQARAVRKDYGESFTSFKERTMTKITTFKYIPKRESPAIVANVLQPAIRFERSQLHNLPKCMKQDFDAELSITQKKAIKELKETLKTMVGHGQINAINEAALRTKLIQVACGAVYGPEHEVHRIDCAPRLQVLEEIIETASHKILILAPLTSVTNMIYSHLRDRYTVEKITGEVNVKARDKIFQNFQESSAPRIIAAHPGCMSHGLTLTEADLTVWYAPTDDDEAYTQANKRMDRPGQQNAMLIARISSTPLEREIYRRLDAGEGMQGLILQLVKEG